MYQPPSFNETRVELMHELVDAFPLGAMVSAGAGGMFATHLPLVLDRTAGTYGTLRGHIARANPHHQKTSTGEALVIFTGPHAYVSPSHYPSKAAHGRVVPTWNYVVVHAYGPLRFVDDRAFVMANVEALTRRHEANRERPWSISDAPAGYIDGLSRAIVGVEIPISRIEGKWKMSQNREPQDVRGVADGLGKSALDGERDVARIVAERLAARDPSALPGTEQS